MAFRLPPGLAVGQQYRATSPSDVAALEAYLPPGSRVLVGLVFERRYDGFEAGCERADTELREQASLFGWPEYPQFVTPDPDGQPIAWVSYRSSPAWWTLILGILGGTFILPIIAILPVWIIEKLFPGVTQAITMFFGLMIVGGLMLFVPRLMAPKEGKE
jgi:hypothetical protein